MFFKLGLHLVDSIPTPWIVQDSCAIGIQGWEVIRYKVDYGMEFLGKSLTLTLQYKLFGVNERESDSLNNYCMCHLEGEDRTMAIFTISLPKMGNYYLRQLL